MKKIAFAFAAFLTALAMYAFIHQPQQPTAFNATAYKAKNIVRCGVDWSALSYLLDETDIPPMPGAGNYQWKIKTDSDSAQFYFNQGINMYYGFHIIEAMASFKKAARFDRQNPMIWWAQALAYGPNINDIEYSAPADALAACRKAASLMQSAAPAEQALIAAMNLRYSADTTQTRETLNEAYADAMKKAYEKFPAFVDACVLYADALMVQHPWDLWNPDGRPKPWTPPIEAILEKALAKAPMHPGANHYYIHVMEPSPYAAKALPSADRVGKLMPGLSHVVHMPSHIYLRTGGFNEGITLNKEALNQYNRYSVLFPAVQQGVFLYLWHNQHMLVNCALLAGRYEDALKFALALRQALDTSMLSMPAPLGNLVQNVYSVSTIVDIRFEKWDSLLVMPKPAAHHVFASILYHFGRGMAFAAKNNMTAALQEEQQLKPLLKHKDLKIPLPPYSPLVNGAVCADEMLLGFISLKQDKLQEGIRHFTTAVETDEAMVYNEPRDWLLNPKQYLGAACLKAKLYAKAEAAFKKDMTLNAQNVWSLYGLQQALEGQRKTTEAAAVKKQFQNAAGKSDVPFSSLFF